MNRQFWADKKLPLHQEMIFASTGTKKKSDPPWKYVEAFAGSDIETNPPATNDEVEKSGRTITSHISELPPLADFVPGSEVMDALEQGLLRRDVPEPQTAGGAIESDGDGDADGV